MYTPQFPKRLDQGESFDYYLLRERLDKALIPYEEKMSLDEPFSIRIDEVTRGTQYYKTKWTLRTFIGKQKATLGLGSASSEGRAIRQAKILSNKRLTTAFEVSLGCVAVMRRVKRRQQGSGDSY